MILTASGAALASQPNVIILIADDMGWNGVGFHNPKAPTPNLNRLAKEGMELQRFYTYPVCSPARAALLTGVMPRRLGLADVIGPRQVGIPKGMATLPATFKAAGYQTSLIGKWHLGNIHLPTEIGFDHFYGFMGSELDYFTHVGQRGDRIDWQRDGKATNDEGYSTFLFADEAIRQMKHRDAARPFLMQIAFNAPHIPLAAPDDLITKHQGDKYAAALDALDSSIGRILGTLDELKLRDDTFVLFFSDNGAPVRTSSNAPLSYGKSTVFEGGIRTPCVIRCPGRVKPGTITQHPVSGQDWFATLTAAAGINLLVNAKLDGTNQWYALTSDKPVTREPFIIAASDIALIDGEWKLIERSNGLMSLFNLCTDISEQRDLYQKEASIAQRLTAKLDELKKDLPAVSQTNGPPGKGGPKGKGKGPPKGRPQ